MFVDMLNHPNFSRYDLSSLQYAVMGGSLCPPELIKNVQQKMGIKSFAVSFWFTRERIRELNRVILDFL